MPIPSAKRIAAGMWWDRAWNLIAGCNPVSPGCQQCWLAAESFMRGHQTNPKIAAAHAGLTTAQGQWTGTVRIRPELLGVPARTRRGQVWSIWSDLFHEAVPDAFILQAFAAMRRAPWHTFIACTKRAERMGGFPRVMPSGQAWPANLIPMVTAEDQPRADLRIPHLLKLGGIAPALAVGVEPMLGPVDLCRYLPCPECNSSGCISTGYPDYDAMECHHCHGGPDREGTGQNFGRVDWLAIGGESGRGPRPMHPSWPADLIAQATAAGVPVFFKGWGNWSPTGDCEASTHWVTESGDWGDWSTLPPAVDAWCLNKASKKAAGREIGGRIYDQFPEAML